MSDAKVRGVVHFIDQTKTYGQNGFRKRLLVLEQDGGRFTNYIPLEFTQDGCDSINHVQLGDELEVEYRLSGRRWQKDPSSEVKFFLNAEAVGYQIVKSKSGAKPEPTGDINDAFAESAEDDDVPF